MASMSLMSTSSENFVKLLKILFRCPGTLQVPTEFFQPCRIISDYITSLRTMPR